MGNNPKPPEDARHRIVRNWHKNLEGDGTAASSTTTPPIPPVDRKAAPSEHPPAHPGDGTDNYA